MFRSYLIASLALSGLLIFGGCAGKTIAEPEEMAAPEVTSAPGNPSSIEEIIPETPVVQAPQVTAIDNFSRRHFETVLFDYDSSSLTTQAQQLLKENAVLLQTNPTVKAMIEGHCDERGSDEYNLALGERRALAAKEYLAKLGVAPERLDIISYGEERPMMPGHEETAWEKNRRVEFK